jgi:hypothetical protein
MQAMGTKSPEVIWGGPIGGAKINAEHARQRAKEAAVKRSRAGVCLVATHGRVRRPARKALVQHQKSADIALNCPTTRRHTVVCRCYGARRRITNAYERTLQKLSLVDRNDLQTEIIAAKKVIELGQRGVWMLDSIRAGHQTTWVRLGL